MRLGREVKRRHSQFRKPGYPQVLAETGRIILISRAPEHDIPRVRVLRLHRVVAGDRMCAGMLPMHSIRR